MYLFEEGYGLMYEIWSFWLMFIWFFVGFSNLIVDLYMVLCCRWLLFYIYVLDSVCILYYILFDVEIMEIYFLVSINLENLEFYRSSGVICFVIWLMREGCGLLFYF